MIHVLEEDWGVSDDDLRPDRRTEWNEDELRDHRSLWERVIDWLNQKF
ncbi:hypothetical protein SEPL_208 [Salmonella phage SE_PL]|nr:hypothetical protein CPT_Munch_219 [Salmonella phage Munch]EHX8550456.1 hypothetical protein [Salmonella enterica]MCP0435759.1 hypothetical protein [Salmonella enterica subsp. enterica serovar Mbandaka]QCW18906.1 hypothetical protein 7t3_0385 [Salmonella phage 7t3]QIG62821.1 hypothetical protein SEPL_208 [Salmonella phage SE_PL]WNV47325.1 hypothetical protein [Klebsiella phage fENko-Kae01]